jgi:small subunit ribosomal protein S6
MTASRRASGRAPLYSSGFSLRQAPLIPERRAQGEAARPREGDTGTVNPYEIMLLLDAELADERQAEILTRTRELVTQRGGTWQSEDAWGRRKLAYEIDKKPEAFYYLLQFDSDAETLGELTRVLKITDGVLRHLAVRRLPPAATMPAREPSSAPPRARGAATDPAVSAAPAGADPVQTAE